MDGSSKDQKRTKAKRPVKSAQNGKTAGGKRKPSSSAAAKKEPSQPLLPEAWSLFLKNTGFRSVGLLVALLAGAIAFILFDYNPLDPTWNRAAPDAVTHRLGSFGAGIADILMQTLGLASWAILVPLLVWAQKIVRLKWLPNFWFNLAMLPIGVVMIALILSVYPPHPDFAVQAGYGGALGQLLYRHLDGLMLGVMVIPAPVYLAVFLIFGLPVYATSFGLRPDEWRRIRAAVWSGIKASGRGIVAVLIGVWRALRQPVRRPNSGPAAAATRAEPRFAASDPVGREPELDLQAAPPVRERKTTKRGKREKVESQPVLPIGLGYQLPTLDLLVPPPAESGTNALSSDALQQNALLLMETLGDFSVSGEIKDVRPGPVVTLYELEPAPGTKSARVIGLSDDIARSMSAVSTRIAVVPGRNRIGIELPNMRRETVFLRELLASDDYERSKAKLAIALGKDIGGAPVTVDLATMPHLLVAGTTGSGKSVGINTMVLSLLYKHAPETLRLIMIDPKMLELSIYDGIPHLLTPVVTDPKKAVVALKWAVREMEERYRKMSLLKVRNLAAFNKKVAEAQAKGVPLVHRVQTGIDPETQEPIIEEEVLEFDQLPYIVVIIDEMADLMIVAGKDVEATVQRLAQMARAAGIHLIMATQRPSVDVITGTIKANFPTRISFQVTSKIDSRTILNEQGAEQLLGKGDMLYMAAGARLMRVHGAFVDDDEVEGVVQHLKAQAKPDYLEEVTEEPPEGFDSPFIPGPSDTGDAEKSLYDQAVDIVLRDRKASTSYIQRRLQVGYNKAATLIEDMERNGVISAPDHKNKREILVPDRSEDG